MIPLTFIYFKVRLKYININLDLYSISFPTKPSKSWIAVIKHIWSEQKRTKMYIAHLLPLQPEEPLHHIQFGKKSQRSKLFILQPHRLQCCELCLLFCSLLLCYLISSNKIFGLETIFHGRDGSRARLFPPSAPVKSSVRNILVFAYWTLIGIASQTTFRSWIKQRTWPNVLRLLITLRSRNPERGFFFFPSPPSSFASSLLDSTDFSSSESLTKSSSSRSRCSECWTDGPASAYALIEIKTSSSNTETRGLLYQHVVEIRCKVQTGALILEILKLSIIYQICLCIWIFRLSKAFELLTDKRVSEWRLNVEYFIFC